MEPVSVQKLHQDGAGIGRGEAIEHAEGVKDRGHGGVVSRVNVHLPIENVKMVILDTALFCEKFLHLI